MLADLIRLNLTVTRGEKDEEADNWQGTIVLQWASLSICPMAQTTQLPSMPYVVARIVNLCNSSQATAPPASTRGLSHGEGDERYGIYVANCGILQVDGRNMADMRQ